MDLRAVDHAQRCRLLEAETARVASWLRSLATRDLDGPAIGDWSIREVIAHLVVVADFYAGNVERGAAGDCAPPPGRPPAGSMRGASAAAGVLAGATATATATSADPLGAFEQSAERLNVQLSGLSEDQLDLPGYHPGGLLPLNRFLLLRAKELCVHEWDMRAPNDASARISELGVAAVLQIIDENIASGSLRWAYRPDAGVAAPLHVAVELDDPVRWSAAFTVTADSVDMHDADEPPTSGPADATIAGDAEAFVRVVYGRLDPDTAAENGALTFDPPELAGRFGRWFTGI